MEANEYQDLTRQTEIYTDAARGFINDARWHDREWFARCQDMLSFMYCTGKLNGEAGEVAEIVFKAFRKNRIEPEDLANLKKELGDVLWYVARLADLCGFKLEDIMKTNIEKLFDRKARGVIEGSGDDR